ncbi:MAG TPA: hypothetical protein VGF59_17275 [Bryobacteraceae bacterium]
MLQSLLNTLFGCPHRRTTFPLTPARKHGAFPAPVSTRNGAYIVCLDCGKEFAYDWAEMRVGQPVPARAPAAEAQPMFR